MKIERALVAAQMPREMSEGLKHLAALRGETASTLLRQIVRKALVEEGVLEGVSSLASSRPRPTRASGAGSA